MNADESILNLEKVDLKNKHFLPEDSGIYYVIDENNIVWYIGKAKNLKKRWNGKAHLRRLVKRLLRKYDYLPEKQEKATVTVLQQAELLCRDWAA